MERTKKLVALMAAASIAAAALSFGSIPLTADAAARKPGESPNYQIIVDKPVDEAKQFCPVFVNNKLPDNYIPEKIATNKYPAVASYYDWVGESSGILRLGYDLYTSYTTTPGNVYTEVSIPSAYLHARKGFMEYYWLVSEIVVEGETYLSDRVSTQHYCNESPFPVTDAIVTGTMSTTPHTFDVTPGKLIYLTFAYNGAFKNGILDTSDDAALMVTIQGISLTVTYTNGTISVYTNKIVQCSSHSSNLNGKAAFAYYQEA